MKLLYLFLGIFIGVVGLAALQSIVRWAERRRGPINCFSGAVWPVVDDPRWRLHAYPVHTLH